MSIVRQRYNIKVEVKEINRILSIKKKYRELLLEKMFCYSLEEVEQILKVVRKRFDSYLLKRPEENFVRICGMTDGYQAKIELRTDKPIPLQMTTRVWERC